MLDARSISPRRFGRRFGKPTDDSRLAGFAAGRPRLSLSRCETSTAFGFRFSPLRGRLERNRPSQRARVGGVEIELGVERRVDAARFRAILYEQTVMAIFR